MSKYKKINDIVYIIILLYYSDLQKILQIFWPHTEFVMAIVFSQNYYYYYFYQQACLASNFSDQKKVSYAT